MLVGRITAASTVRGETVIWRAEVSGSDNDRSSGDAPADVIHAADLEAGTADLPASEKSLAQTHSGHAISRLDKVTVAARTAHHVTGIRRGIVGGPSR